ncbi:MAG: zinc ribbon domain-containing protein [Planctomycetales bacterium]|nr:zinc ribbon domain-containing protein [Planctomycetales bacterium]
MPLYEFTCPKCGHEQEHLVRSDEQPACESCGHEQLTRLLSVPAAHSASPGGQPPAGPCGSGCGCFPG